MFLALNIKTAVIAAAFAAGPMAVFATVDVREGTAAAPALVELAPSAVRYAASGEFTRGGKPVDPPAKTIVLEHGLTIMRNLVTVAEYRRCVDDRACSPDAGASERPDLPVTMVSWRDARAYAAWLSGKLGHRYRLPTDEEWTFAAGSRAPNRDAFTAADAAARWLERYEREARSLPVDPVPKPAGSFGTNENGLTDVAGNVWEWTDSCFTRSLLDGDKATVVTVNCGVRVVEGRHRTYVSDFIRDARAGGCAAGTPPSNLGFRLVREPEPAGGLLARLGARLRRAWA